MVISLGEKKSTNEPSEALWEDWYKVAEPVNKFAAWVTIGLSVVVFFVYGLNPWYNPFTLQWVFSVSIYGIVAAIAGIMAGIFYFIFVQKSVANQDLTKMMHIWLLVCTGLACVAYFWAGALIILQFVMVGILSDKPFWVAFGE